MSSVKVMQPPRDPLSKVRWPAAVQRIEKMDTERNQRERMGIVLDEMPRELPRNTGPNRHERRKGEAQARKARKLFGRYKSHMASHGYDATYDDFVQSIP